MRLDLDALPTDVGLLHQLVRDLAADLGTKDARLGERAAEIERLKLQLARLQRAQFGRRSEKLDPDQLALQLDAVAEALAAAEADQPAAAEAKRPPSATRGRKPLPAHLPRREERHDIGCSCAGCGGAMQRIGEDVTEMLDYEPARFVVIRHVRAKYACRACEAIAQAPMPASPIERGRPGPGLLAQVLVAKYCDHLPLYRQAMIYARDGVELDRSTMADWVAGAGQLLRPLHERLAADVMRAAKLHADDTPVPVLAPGNGRTKTGRLWTYVRDDRPWDGPDPPAAVYFYSPHRKGEAPRAHLKDFRGFLQADAYAGYDGLYTGAVVEVACWAHARRKFYDVHVATGAPLAAAALERIARLYGVEGEVRGQEPERRRAARQERSAPEIAAMRAWLEQRLATLAPKSDLAAAMRYTLGHWTALTRFLADGRLEIDNSAAERALRGVALGRKNWLFAGSDRGGESAAIVLSLIETCRLNRIDPFAYLRDVLGRLNDYPAKRIDELLPHRWSATPTN